jgi:hypothetical protein
MDCERAEEEILESFAEGRLRESGGDLELHLASCEKCRTFLEAQRMLDLRLSAAISAPSLSPAFRASLAERLQHEAVPVWPEFLPDAAHVAGCLCATALCAWVLPFAGASVWIAGLAFTVVTYLLQAAVQGSLEIWGQDP